MLFDLVVSTVALLGLIAAIVVIFGRSKLPGG